MDKRTAGLSIVIPALNEEKGLPATLAGCSEAFGALEGIPCEIVVVDDGSSDNTSAIAKEAGATIVRHPARAGYGRSLKDGISAAKYDTIIITDADGTYPVEHIPVLYSKYLEGFDMVVGARTGANYRQSIFKFSLRRVLKFLVEWASGQKIDDINSGFRIFSKKEAQKFYFHLCDTFSFTTSMTLSYMMTGKLVGYIPTEYYERAGSSHVRLFRDAVRTFFYILKQILYFDPLKIFFLFALIWVGFGFIGFLISVVTPFRFGYYASILSVFGFFMMLGLGLIAEQLRQLINYNPKSKD